MLVNLIFKEVFLCRSGVRRNFTASTKGNTKAGFCALAHMEFYLYLLDQNNPNIRIKLINSCFIMSKPVMGHTLKFVCDIP